MVWGSDAVWTGAPQWQIEGLRRLEIPEDMQARHGLRALGPANGPIKNAIFGENTARLYDFEITQYAWRSDRLAQAKAAYVAAGPSRSNLRYGYVNKDQS